MRPKRLLGWISAGVVAALAIAWFSLGTSEFTGSPAREAQVPETHAPATEPAEELRNATAAEHMTTAPVAVPAAAAQAQRRADEAKKITDAFERGVTPTFVAYLVSKGASREDSERIVADAMQEMASCVRDAMPEQPASLALPADSPPVRASGTFVLFNDRVRNC